MAVTIDTAAGTINSIYSPGCRVYKALCTRQPGKKEIGLLSFNGVRHLVL